MLQLKTDRLVAAKDYDKKQKYTAEDVIDVALDKLLRDWLGQVLFDFIHGDRLATETVLEAMHCFEGLHDNERTYGDITVIASCLSEIDNLVGVEAGLIFLSARYEGEPMWKLIATSHLKRTHMTTESELYLNKCEGLLKQKIVFPGEVGWASAVQIAQGAVQWVKFELLKDTMSTKWESLLVSSTPKKKSTKPKQLAKAS